MKRTAWLHGLITSENSERKDGTFDIGRPEDLYLYNPEEDIKEFSNGIIDYYQHTIERVENGNV